jgi:nucleoside-diphosphate-sugar epimerase
LWESCDLITGGLGNFNLENLLRFSPDTIFHLARLKGEGRVGRYFASKKGRRYNDALKSFLSSNSLNPTLVYFSGTLLYGDRGNEIVNEDYKLNPTSFARQYHIAETPLYESIGNENFTTIMLRLPWVVGNGSWFIGSYINYAVNHGYVPLYGDGANWMSLIDREDCCSLAIHLRKKVKVDTTINIFNPELIFRQIDFAEALSDVLGLKMKKVDISEYAWRDPALKEAMSFSLKVDTKHTNLYEGFTFKISDLELLIKRNLPTDLHGTD